MADLSQFTVQNLFNIKGWVAVVTGGGTGLGLITAQALAANGAKVYITGRRAEKLKEAELDDATSGGSIRGIQMDCTDKQSIQEGVKAIQEKFVNLLVNNAGRTSGNYGPKGFPTGDINSISEELLNNHTFENWLEIYKINVASCYFTSAAFLPLLVAARDNGYSEAGSILNISSIAGLTKDSLNGQFSYNASKAATISLTKQLAVDFKRPGIEVRVNTLAPGFFPSEMNPIARDDGQQKDFFRNEWGIPFGRAGEAAEYAQAVLNFAKNGYITGSTLAIDGGWLLAHA
ncbi:related to dehydrogenases with different specificities (related to short-chain alcohol dehydrogenases) [Ramularia collo-cygni]|uniref:Related to dehydrogenases with different specificities (Related to short-chain alcohol dehydrogenases) n=1 Tax=Ramularia collo-cygni TaxID=112498 RepID=A0A2D3UNZ6_9PEZI|nr:related to dehydrogenases with different specificities (related to short-chain alcohol dehydrogenases) [Ramularia collo-cygni]CZT16861.1 related to dehydrogenases with different specificities (related to short-chain alcohol dehydrogenases) [Ramularia collo-cygni]